MIFIPFYKPGKETGKVSNYMLSGHIISDLINKLNQDNTRINFIHSRADGRDGFIFSEEDLKSAMPVMGISCDIAKATESIDLPGIFHLPWRETNEAQATEANAEPPAPEFAPETEIAPTAIELPAIKLIGLDFLSERQRETAISAAKSKLRPAVTTEIIYFGGGKRFSYLPQQNDNAAFYIYGGSVGKKHGRYYYSDEDILGSRRSGIAYHLSTYEGISFNDPKSGLCLAELLGENFNHLYIHFDTWEMMNTSPVNAGEVLERLFTLVSDRLLLGRESLELELSGPRTKLDISTSNDYYAQAMKLARICNDQLLPKIVKTVVLHIGDGFRNVQPVSDGCFHIWSSSSPSYDVNMAELKRPASIHGISLEGNWKICQSSGSGIDILDAVSEITLAELVNDDNLFLHMSYHHYNFPNSANIFAGIIEETVQLLTLSQKEKALRQAEQKQKRLLASQENYVAACNKRYLKLKKSTENEIANVERDVAAYMRELSKSIRVLEEAKLRLLNFDSISSDLEDKLRREYRMISEMPAVENIDVTEEFIRIFTKNVYISAQHKNYNNGETGYYDIGRFRIDIRHNSADSDFKVVMTNLTRQGKGSSRNYNINHPHVNSSGYPCLGNISTTVVQLSATYEYALLTDVLIQFLYSVNFDNDEAGLGIFTCWPQVSQEEYERGMNIDYAKIKSGTPETPAAAEAPKAKKPRKARKS